MPALTRSRRISCSNSAKTAIHAHCPRNRVPRLKSNVTRRELIDLYTPTEAEVELAGRVSKDPSAKVPFLILLKTFQLLGYFIALREVPRCIVEHIANDQGMLFVPDNMEEYDESGTRRRHVPIIRKYLRVKTFDESGQALLSTTIRRAAARMEDLADIINIAIEELIRHSFELPGFTSLTKEAQRGRAEVNRALYRQVYDALTAEGRNAIDTLLAEPASESHQTRWNMLKQDAGSPTLTLWLPKTQCELETRKSCLHADTLCRRN